MKLNRALILSALGLVQAGQTMPAHGQILATPDGAAGATGTNVSLPVNQQVENSQINITGGQPAGTNLFHSFQEFSTPQGQTANFVINPLVQNVLTRVSGGNPSIINGLVQVTNGNANLFLMNPAGILFGPKASLNLPGSFLATTANGMRFGDNGWFSAVGTNNYGSLLGNPAELAFTIASPGSIVNAGNLSVKGESSIALAGGIIINTGTITTPNGIVSIKAVSGKGLVSLGFQGDVLDFALRGIENENLPINDLPFTPTSLPALITGGTPSIASGVVVEADGKIKLTASSSSFDGKPGSVIISGSIAQDVVNRNSSKISIGADIIALDPTNPFKSKGRQIEFRARETTAGNIISDGGDTTIGGLPNDSLSAVKVGDIDTSTLKGSAGIVSILASRDIITGNITTQSQDQSIIFDPSDNSKISVGNPSGGISITSETGIIKVENIKTGSGNLSINGSSIQAGDIDTHAQLVTNAGFSNRGIVNLFATSGDIEVKSIASGDGGVSINASKSVRITGSVPDEIVTEGGTSVIARPAGAINPIALKDSPELIDFFESLGRNRSELEVSETKFKINRKSDSGTSSFPVSIIAFNRSFSSDENSRKTKVSISYGGSANYPKTSIDRSNNSIISIKGSGGNSGFIIGPEYNLAPQDPKFILDPDESKVNNISQIDLTQSATYTIARNGIPEGITKFPQNSSGLAGIIFVGNPNNFNQIDAIQTVTFKSILPPKTDLEKYRTQDSATLACNIVTQNSRNDRRQADRSATKKSTINPCPQTGNDNIILKILE
jgi:filamentous hemagglutinin family protein